MKIETEFDIGEIIKLKKPKCLICKIKSINVTSSPLDIEYLGECINTHRVEWFHKENILCRIEINMVALVVPS